MTDMQSVMFYCSHAARTRVHTGVLDSYGCMWCFFCVYVYVVLVVVT